MFAAYYNLCWQTRKPGKSGQQRGTAAMMAGLAGHVWSFDELFETVLNPATHSQDTTQQRRIVTFLSLLGKLALFGNQFEQRLLRVGELLDAFGHQR